MPCDNPVENIPKTYFMACILKNIFLNDLLKHAHYSPQKKLKLACTIFYINLNQKYWFNSILSYLK